MASPKKKICTKCYSAALDIFKSSTHDEKPDLEEKANKPELLKKPRRFMTPYIAFVKSSWAEHNAANPDSHMDREGFKQFTRNCAGKWKEMSDEEKVLFEEQSAQEKATYVELMVAYKAQQLEMKKNAPKRPLNAYMMFVVDEREKVRKEMSPEAKVVDIAKELGRRWVALEPEAKEAYKAKASQARLEYDAQREEEGDYSDEGLSSDQKTDEESDYSNSGRYTDTSSIYSSSSAEYSYSYSEDDYDY